MAYFSAEKADSEYVWGMSGIDFAMSKDEFTFQIPALETSPKTRGALGCASGVFKPLPFADQNFGKSLDSLQTNGGKFSKIYTLKCRKMNF